MTVIISGSGGITDVNGTAAAPAITGTDTDTGVFFGTNTVSLSTGGTERLQVDSSGNLGLGVTPSAWGSGYKALDIQYLGISNTGAGTVDCSFTQNGYYNGTNWIAKYTSPSKRYSISDSGFIWYNGASATAGNAITFTQAMTLDASGNLGVGSTSPGSYNSLGYRLVVGDGAGNEGITIASGTGDNGSLLFADGTSGGAAYSGYVQYDHSDNSMRIGTSATERARIDSSGQFGIGTTSPSSSMLHVRGNWVSGHSTVKVQTATAMSSGGVTGIGFYNSDGTRDMYISADNTSFNWWGTSVKPIIFATSDTERARIHSGGGLSIAGGLGVGTSSAYSSSIFFSGSVLPSGAGTNAIKWNNTNGNVTYDTSSRLIKENIEDSPYGLSEVMQLQSRRYFRTDDQKTEVGFIADEVEAIIPELVSMGPKSLLTKNEEDTDIVPFNVSYERLTSVLVNAIKEQQAIITQLQADVAALKGKA